MHELAVTEGMLKVVLRHAELNRAKKVVGITLRIGEMSDIVDEWLKRYFDYLSRDTIAEGAEIIIERSPAVFRCGDCGEEYIVKLKGEYKFSCPECSTNNVDLIAGREFLVQELKVV
ncbi:MAG: hydrogenase maturation nickel metallochaperone HypA [Syntrophomonadales bacterium]|jgi:hydrogenase nickel incorporation protein HypA/HybF